MIDTKQIIKTIEAEIDHIEYPKNTPMLYRPISYTLKGGGKRLRPMLVAAICQAFCGDYARALNQAVALEMFHNFTLIHDDVMDRSPRRHGHPTVYRRWGETQAILSGDALLTMATQRVVQGCPTEQVGEVLALFNKIALEVYEGQQLDTAYEQKEGVTPDRYLKMIQYKTAALIAGACKMGALIGGANAESVAAIYEFGHNLGMAFQLRDDWLDIYGDYSAFGKRIGNDILTRKKTWFYITAQCEAAERLDSVYDADYTNTVLISKVRRVFDSLNLSNRCNRLIDTYCDAAIAALQKAGLAEDDALRFEHLVHELSTREK